ncbi:Teichuronic acid biosynthesis protein TuaB [Planctomycetes bacterium CA13]|uniref:Teichuronic acid biosynthesis protein TuaB n=2 Tax=Novipirellula herctigrandis TaxID=2527986 RepID=A0A5C5YXD2_9BACT|nr:Teichuronic acid biosynthesis protein TuaB [Planctomycetes bacterium CA13]
MPGLKQTAVTGVKYTAFANITTQLFKLSTLAVLAVLLSPEDFGLIGLATIVTGFIAIFQDLGTGAAIVQRQEHDDSLLGTVFIFNVAIAITTTSIVYASAPLIANYFGEALLSNVLRVLSTTFVLSSISIVPVSLLQHRLAFRSLAIVEVAAATIAGGIGITLAILGYGVWSLVFQSIASVTTITVLAYALSRWVPVLHFSREQFASVFRFSSNLTMSTVLNYFVRNADYFLIGKYLGPSALGIYTLAYRLMLLPVQNLSSVISKVMFPVFSKSQHDHERFRAGYLQVSQMISLLSFPAMVGMFIVAVPMIVGFFGEKWSESGHVLMILAPLGMSQSLASTVGIIYQAKGRTDQMLRWTIFATAVVVPAFIIGVRYGVTGVAYSYLAASILITIPGFMIPFKLIELPLSSFFSAIRANLFCSLLMGLLVWISGYAFGAMQVPVRIAVVLQVVIGAVSYVFITYWLNRESMLMFVKLLKSRTTSSQIAP